MQGKLNKNVGFSLIIFAFFFLFEPSYSLIDPLPDFIGYSILCLALINLADINDKIYTAFKAFRKGIILSALKVISIVILNKVFADGEQTVGSLLFVFVFAVFELIILIPAYRSLFEGLLSLGIFHGGEAVYFKRRENGKNATERLYSFTIAFLIAKNVICALPEFTSLQTNSSYEFVNILRILAIIVVMPVSVLWLVQTVAYFKRIKGDRAFIESLSEKYIQRANDAPDFFVCRTLTIGLYAILAAFIFSFDFYVENVNLLPDFLFYGVLILSVIFLRKYSVGYASVIIMSTVGALISLGACVVEKGFFSRFYIEAVIKDIDAYNQYNLLVIFYVVKALVFLSVLVFALKSIYGIFVTCIGSRHSSDDTYYIEHNKKIKTRAFICFALGFLSALSTVYRVIALPRHEISWIFYYSGIITSALQITFVVAVCALILYLVGEIKYNYKSYL